MDTPLVQRLTTLLPTHGKRLRQRMARLRRPAWLGTLQRTTPLSDGWGYDRGTPVDRYYIESFLAEHHADICGRVLEVHSAGYSRRFGANVQRSDVLDIDPNNANATIVADLTAADAIAAESFDCFILTQTLHLICDVPAALSHAHRILRPGGVLLATVPSVSKIVEEYGGVHDYWRFTPSACRVLFGQLFGASAVSVHAYGNVLTAIAFLTGMAQEELGPQELAVRDPHFPVIVGVRAVKQAP